MRSIIISILCLLSLVVSAQAPATLAISGSSFTEVTPDITVVNISIETIDLDYSEAIDLLQKKGNKIKTFLKRKDVDQSYIKAENFSINKSYSYEDHKQVFKGYEATLWMKLEFLNNNEQANEIINAIGESKSDANVSVHFKMSLELEEKINDQLIEAAITDAQKKAQIIARSTNKTLGQITKINYGVQENLSVTNHSEGLFRSMDASSMTREKNSLSITPQTEKHSTDIIIYWTLQ